MTQRAPLPVRHHPARRRADHRRRFFARRQEADRRACSTRSASIMSRAAIPAPIRSTPNFSQPRARRQARFAAFGMTQRAGRSAANDPGIAALLDSDADAIASSPRPGTIRCASRSAAPWRKISTAMTDSRRSRSRRRPRGHPRLRAFLRRLQGQSRLTPWPAPTPRYEAGARWIVLCDTNGGTLPHEVERIVGEVAAHVPGDHLGIHAHNDTEQAVANSLAAVRAGARQIHGTLNGLGERCGNANLCSIIPTPAAETRVRRKIRDRRQREAAARPDQGQPCAGRNAQSRAQPPRALCRRLGLRHQGGHPRLRGDEGPAHL